MNNISLRCQFPQTGHTDNPDSRQQKQKGRFGQKRVLSFEMNALLNLDCVPIVFPHSDKVFLPVFRLLPFQTANEKQIQSSDIGVPGCLLFDWPLAYRPCQHRLVTM